MIVKTFDNHVHFRNSFGFKVKLGQVTFSLEKVSLGTSRLFNASFMLAFLPEIFLRRRLHITSYYSLQR